MKITHHFLTHLATHAERQPDKIALRISKGGAVSMTLMSARMAIFMHGSLACQPRCARWPRRASAH